MFDLAGFWEFWAFLPVKNGRGFRPIRPLVEGFGALTTDFRERVLNDSDWWAVMWAKPKCEERAVEDVSVHGEAYRPLVRTKVVSRGRVSYVTSGLFGRYFLFRLGSCWQAAARASSVGGVVKIGDEPCRCHDREVSEIKRREEGGFVLLQDEQFRKGQAVRAIGGMLIGQSGTFDRRVGTRVRALFAALGGVVPFEMDEMDLEAI